jgi:hypothetical protein
MRTTSSISATALRPFGGGRERPSRLGPPSRLPTIVPTRSSYLQRLLWLFGFGR